MLSNISNLYRALFFSRAAVLVLALTSVEVMSLCRVSGQSNQLVTGKVLYQAANKELEDRLARNERFTLLPNNLDQIALHPLREPIFCLTPEELRGSTNLDLAAETWPARPGGFRLVQGGEVLGLSENEAVVWSRATPYSTEYRIMGPTGVKRSLRFPTTLGVKSAFPMDAEWGFKGSPIIQLGESTNSDQSIRDSYGKSLIIQDHDQVIVVNHSDSPRGASLERTLLIATKNKTGIQRETFTFPYSTERATEGVIRLEAGGWLGIGYKLISLQLDFPAEPAVEQLEAVLKAAHAGDRASLEKAMAVVTQYTPNQLAGLCKSLNEMPNLWESTEILESSAAQGLSAAQALRLPAGLSESEKARALAVAASYANSIEQFLTALQQIKAGPLGFPPRSLALIIQQGFQFFDHQWIASPKVLAQDGVDSTVLDTFFYDRVLQKKRGIFRLNHDGHLTLLGEYQDMIPPREESDYFETSQWQYLKTPAQGELLFWPRLGLARLAGGKLEWMDRSEQFKTLHKLLGCDRVGRLYFAAAPNEVYLDPVRLQHQKQGLHFWVYRPASPIQASPVRLLFPVVTTPVMDSSHRVWFLPAGVDPRQKLGSLQQSSEVVKAMKLLGEAPRQKLEIDQPAPDPGEQVRYEARLNLCCYDRKSLSLLLTNLSSSTALIAGPNDAIIGIPRGQGTAGAFIIDQGRTILRSNLHILARQKFELLLAAAPPETMPPPDAVHSPNSDFLYYVAASRNPSLSRIGDTLWINHSGRVDAYRNGESLGFYDRMTLMNCPSDQMVGPLKAAGGPAMVFVGEMRGNYPTAVFWALPGASGFELKRQNDLPISAPGIRPAEANFASLNPRPVLDSRKGCLYFGSGDNALEICGPDQSRVLANSGHPVLVTREGELLVERWPKPYRGFRLCRGEDRRDILPTYSNVLLVVKETEDQQLLCFSPEGLVWLKAGPGGEYHIDREFPLHHGGFLQSFVGETVTEYFLTLTDGRNQRYLAIVDKP